MNLVAETVTGWSQAEAVGRPLPAVFRIINERTRQPVEDPVAKVLTSGVVLGLANHTLLLARDGTERPIDDTGAPIRDHDGRLAGVVLIFRDITERRRAEQAAEAARAYAEAIVETVREPLVVIDADLHVKTANRSFYQTFPIARAEMEGRSLYDVGNGVWDIPQLRALLEDVLLQNGHFDDFEVEQEFEGVGRRIMLLNGRNIYREDSRTKLILLAIEDVTERRRAERAVEVSETRYRRLFETAQDGILILDADQGQILDANPFLTAMLGYTHHEFVGKELWELGLFRDKEANQAAFQQLQETAYIRYDDLPLQSKDGHHINVEFVSNVYLVDHQRIIQCNIRDVTTRKRAEEALREAHDLLERRVAERTADLAEVNETLKAEIARHQQTDAARREAVQQLINGKEAERHRLARELHDRMGQHLTALMLGLKMLRDGTAGTPELSSARERLQQLQELADLMGREIHHLALELRPTALDDLGLHTALANYVEEWSARSGVGVDLHSTGLDGKRLPSPIETVLYRIVQEGLTNVLKHAQARRVSLILRRSPDQVLAILEDDGCGVDADAAISSRSPRSRLGLVGMRERVALVGGTLTIESTPGRGTTLFARIPLSPDGEEASDGQ